MKLPTSTAETLLKRAGAERVSENAKEALNTMLKKKAEIITKNAAVFAKHAGRKTVKKTDIELSCQSH